MQHFTEWLRRAYERVTNRRPSNREDRGYAEVPRSALVTNRLSNRASFASCVYRRIGYIAHVRTEDLAVLDDGKSSDARQAWMEDAWVRGITWMPLLIEAEVVDGRWRINRIKDLDVAAFLSTRQKMLVVQVMEPDKASGTAEKLALLHNGLHLPDGRRCPVVFARVTY